MRNAVVISVSLLFGMFLCGCGVEESKAPTTECPECPDAELQQKQRYLDCLNDQTREDDRAIRMCRWLVLGEGNPLATPAWYSKHGRRIAKDFAAQMPPLPPLLERCEADFAEGQKAYHELSDAFQHEYRRLLTCRAQRKEWEIAFGHTARDFAEHLDRCGLECPNRGAP